jgi:hypothetical protein
MSLFNFGTPGNSASEGPIQSSAKPKGLVKWISYGIKIASIILLLNTLYSVVGNIYMLSVGQSMEGTITGSYREEVSQSYSSRRGSSNSRSVGRPVISYEFNGQSYKVHGDIVGAMGTNYEMNEKVALLILPNNPDYSVINSFMEMWLVPMLLIILCFVLFGFGHVLHHIVSIVSRMMRLSI